MYCRHHVQETDNDEGSRGKDWSYQETVTLLQYWADPTIQSQLDGSHRNLHVYQTLVALIHQDGQPFARTAVRCRERIKRLTIKYWQAKKIEERSGTGAVSFQFFDMMDHVLRGRPLTKKTNNPVCEPVCYVHIKTEDESNSKEEGYANCEAQFETDRQLTNKHNNPDYESMRFEEMNGEDQSMGQDEGSLDDEIVIEREENSDPQTCEEDISESGSAFSESENLLSLENERKGLPKLKRTADESENCRKIKLVKTCTVSEVKYAGESPNTSRGTDQQNHTHFNSPSSASSILQEPNAAEVKNTNTQRNENTEKTFTPTPKVMKTSTPTRKGMKSLTSLKPHAKKFVTSGIATKKKSSVVQEMMHMFIESVEQVQRTQQEYEEKRWHQMCEREDKRMAEERRREDQRDMQMQQMMSLHFQMMANLQKEMIKAMTNLAQPYQQQNVTGSQPRQRPSNDSSPSSPSVINQTANNGVV